jgi:hypothetical protein
MFIDLVPPGWTLANVGDHNGDQKNDIIWMNGSTLGRPRIEARRRIPRHDSDSRAGSARMLGAVRLLSNWTPKPACSRKVVRFQIVD